jgi:hypothetical protein
MRQAAVKLHDRHEVSILDVAERHSPTRDHPALSQTTRQPVPAFDAGEVPLLEN